MVKVRYNVYHPPQRHLHASNLVQPVTLLAVTNFEGVWSRFNIAHQVFIEYTVGPR